MCGICGVLNFRDEAVNREILEDMNQTLFHRGPDDEGLFVDQRVGMAMRRLSIIDLENGKQPIHNEDQSVHVVQNGEIYNIIITTLDGDRLDVKGVKRLNNIIDIKVLDDEGTIYAVKAISLVHLVRILIKQIIAACG